MDNNFLAEWATLFLNKGHHTIHTIPPTSGQVYVEPNIMVEGNRLGVVDSFVCLGRTLSRNSSLDAEISGRIAKASTAFGKLEEPVWSDRGITTNTN